METGALQNAVANDQVEGAMEVVMLKKALEQQRAKGEAELRRLVLWFLDIVW